MVEIEQEEIERLKAIETEHKQLVEDHKNLKIEHDKLSGEHNTLKNDYIALSKGQQDKVDNKTDDFDTICAKKFGKNN